VYSDPLKQLRQEGVQVPIETDQTDADRLVQLAWRTGDVRTLGVEGHALPPRLSASGTLRRIYEAALLLFGERGYHAVSVRDIAREVGVHASSIYAHVTSKQQLLGDLIRLGHDEHRDWLRHALLEVGTNPADQLAALVRAHTAMHATFPLLARLSNRELGSLDPPIRADVLAVRLEAERMFVDAIERGQRLGAFADVDPILALAAIGAMGIRVAEWWHPDLGIAIADVADTYATFALRLLT
jgi:AcrR family transcriptional regulator